MGHLARAASLSRDLSCGYQLLFLANLQNYKACLKGSSDRGLRYGKAGKPVELSELVFKYGLTLIWAGDESSENSRAD
uniref:Uncharacterized protein n=1 Tax=Hyaloperonospora arabidopsidis (strain Emoy2) TaxID=559515 RepID=M4C6K8_HYAAE